MPNRYLRVPVLRLFEFDTGSPCQLAWQEASLAASTNRTSPTLLSPSHPPPAAADGKERGFLKPPFLATKLIHLPDKPAGVAEIGTQSVETDAGINDTHVALLDSR